MRKTLALTLMLTVLAGCSVGTKYTRPGLVTPDSFRGQEAPPAGESEAAPGWWDVYKDETLRGLIKAALENNYDVKIAAARVEEFRANTGVSGTARLPRVSAGFNARSSRRLVNQTGGNPETRDYKAAVDASYEVDLWGRLASLDEAARAGLLSTEYAAEGVRTALVSDVATSYFDLLKFDRQLDIARRTVKNREKFFDLTKSQYDRGAVSMLEVGRAASSLSQAKATIPDLMRQVEQTENLLSTLLGKDPGPITRPGSEEAGMPELPEVPAGLPSSLVERRPDIRQAEAGLMAANARVNATKALLYPAITLTGELGIGSASLKSLFDGPSGIWSFAAGLIQPIIDSERTGYQVDAAQARKDQATLQYYYTVQDAFRDVSDSLAARKYYKDMKDVLDQEVEELEHAEALSVTRFEAGYSSYFEVIETQGALFVAQLQRAQANRDALVSVVRLYNALGGGWDGKAGGKEATGGAGDVPAAYNAGQVGAP